MSEKYNIEEAIARIEQTLIDSFIRQLKKSTTMKALTDNDIESWTIEQLKGLDEFKKRNRALFTSKLFVELVDRISEQLEAQYEKGGKATKKDIDEAIKKGFKPSKEPDANLLGVFSGVNDRKLIALINETSGNLYAAEYSALRYAEDAYRRIIFDAHVYLQSGSGTLPQAIDMATKDFLSRGIDCVEYKNGARVNIQSYSEMALRTANKRAYMQGEAGMRDEYGLDLVIVTRRGDACPKCMEWVGKVFVDDVYGNTGKNGVASKYPLLSTAIAGGLYHPNCRDVHTTFFEGITTERPLPTEAEKEEATRIYNLEQQQRYNERQIRKYDRLAKGSIDEANVEKYKMLKKKWQKINKDFVDSNPELRRRYYREKAITLDK